VKTKLGKLTCGALLGALPGLLYALSGGPPLKRTGAAVDGGLNCTACHVTYAPANSDARGRVVVQAKFYTPGLKQVIRVRVEHPEAQRWGFELTARLASDETKTAGTLSATSTVQVRCDDGSFLGVQAPCTTGQLEFASHNSTSTAQSKPNFNTWDVEWTPPSTDVGEVVFYAAGNAANNNLNNQGDRIYTTSTRISSCSLSERPRITGIVNGASFAAGGSQNAMVTVFGGGFVAASQARSAAISDFDDLDFPSELACLAVEIGGKRAPISFVNDKQINAQVPVSAVGPVEVRVVANPGRPNEIRGNSENMTLTATSPAFFVFGTTKSIAALYPDSTQAVADPSVVPGGRAAKPGEVVTLYGTGFGATSKNLDAGKVATEASEILDRLTVTIGNLILAGADVSYAGLSPGSISGLYQFNVKVPVVPDGDTPVTIDIGGVKTQTGAFIPVKR
jgi:uncharacterized protein (TIGR03437 family)